MKKLIVLIVCLIMTGCVSGKVTVAQNGECSMEYNSFWKDMQAPEANLCGSTFGSAASDSNVDAVSILVDALIKSQKGN